jgi:hypothetical protein
MQAAAASASTERMLRRYPRDRRVRAGVWQPDVPVDSLVGRRIEMAAASQSVETH